MKQSASVSSCIFLNTPFLGVYFSGNWNVDGKHFLDTIRCPQITGVAWWIYWTSLQRKNKTEAVKVRSELDSAQSIRYSRINHLYKMNAVTLYPLCLWNLKEGREGKHLLVLLKTKEKKKKRCIDLYMKVTIESPCVSHFYYQWTQEILRKTTSP